MTAARPTRAAHVVGHGRSRGVGVPDLRSGSASVAGVFRIGCYLRHEGHLFALLPPSAPDGPIHLVLHDVVPRLREGATVRFQDGLAHTEDGIVDLRALRRWWPAESTPVQRRRARPLLAAQGWDASVPPDLATVWAPVCAAVASGELAAASALLAGRGSGLTPTGDDVLAGLLLGASELRVDPAALAAVAAGAATGELSRTFLHWAARGHSIDPLHRVLAEAGRGRRGAVGRAAAEVAAVGASSGRALLAGLGLAARLLPTTEPGAAPLSSVPSPQRS